MSPWRRSGASSGWMVPPPHRRLRRSPRPAGSGRPQDLAHPLRPRRVDRSWCPHPARSSGCSRARRHEPAAGHAGLRGGRPAAGGAGAGELAAGRRDGALEIRVVDGHRCSVDDQLETFGTATSRRADGNVRLPSCVVAVERSTLDALCSRTENFGSASSAGRCGATATCRRASAARSSSSTAWPRTSTRRAGACWPGQN